MQADEAEKHSLYEYKYFNAVQRMQFENIKDIGIFILMIF